MTDFDFDTPIERRGTDSTKWRKYAGRDVLPMWVADMDFAAPPAVIEALRRRVDHAVFGYGDPPPSLVEAVLEALERDHHWRITPESIVWLPGLVTGLNVCCRAVGEAGDEVLTASPVYPPFFSAPRNGGRDTLAVPLALAGGRWEWDLDAAAAAVTARTRLLMLCNPHNPVGRAFDRGELEALAGFAARHDLTLCADEIHAGLVLDPGLRHLSIAALDPEIAARTITLLAPSKTWNVPGLGCAFAVISDEPLRRRFLAAMRGIVPHVNLLGFAAAEAAYREGEPWRQALLAYLRENAALVQREIATMPGLVTWPVEATYLSWIDARGAGLADPVAFFEQAGVGLSNGADFGAPGFVRLNFGCTRALLAEALARMRSAVGALPGRCRS
jgi:cystathionine beta-lyase